MALLEKAFYSRAGQALAAKAGLPEPPVLRRGRTLPTGPVVLAQLDGATVVAETLDLVGVEVVDPVLDAGGEELPRYPGPIGALVVDATGLRTIDSLESLRAVLRPAVRALEPSGRVILVATAETAVAGVEAHAVARALDGINRTIGKEVRGGATSNLVYLQDGVRADALASTLSFLLEGRSAFVDGQSWTVAAVPVAEQRAARPETPGDQPPSTVAEQRAARPETPGDQPPSTVAEERAARHEAPHGEQLPTTTVAEERAARPEAPHGEQLPTSTVAEERAARPETPHGEQLPTSTVAEERAARHEAPLTGRIVVVTGAARGIGAAIARVLARDGARVVAVDVPAAGDALSRVANEVRGTALQLDITAPAAGARIAEHVVHRYGIDARIHGVVHNAGITRDKLLANTDAGRWASVLQVNLAAQVRINEVLLDPSMAGGLAEGGRLVGIASTSGIAGNRGQTNYAASKAGVVGVVRAMAPELAGRGITVNAVAPGFIETEMTGRIPFVQREIFRRTNSLRQGGKPVDVAETIAYFLDPASQGVTGQVIRVCGQNLVGA